MNTATIINILESAGYATWTTHGTRHVRTNATIAQCSALGLIAQHNTAYSTSATGEFKVMVRQS